MVRNDRGHIFIDKIEGSPIVNFGGSLVVSPKTIRKTAYGAGSGNTANFNFSSTNTNIVDLFEQLVDGND